jgi:hypothetical protein
MLQFTARIEKFGQQGEKTGWTYIAITAELAQQLKPNNKKAFRVKGYFDDHPFEGISLVPMGGGDFILALNAGVRKIIGKGSGAMVKVSIAVDDRPVTINPELIECLSDEPKALAYFNKLPKSHQNYFSKWIESAKSVATKSKRIALTVMACERQQPFGEMMRSLKEEKKDLLG